MKSLAGNLLIAIPELPDSNFYQSVVLLIEHSDEGAIGVVLNRRANVKLTELWEQLDSGIDVTRDDNVFIGGPVQGPVLALHDQYQYSDSHVMDGVYMTMDSDQLNRLVLEPSGAIKVFSGYSGWASNQLESEIERGGWLVLDAEPQHVYGGCEDLWKDVCERVGQNIMLPKEVKNKILGDPNMN